MRLGILSSHPIQYQSPWFRQLAKNCDLEVFFAHRQTAVEQGQAGFGVAFEWDVDLVSGYKHRYLKNISRSSSVYCYSGCDTPEILEIIRKERFDAFIVSGWYLKCYRQAIRACQSEKIPVMVRGDSQLQTPRSWVKRIGMEVRQRWLLSQFDAFLSVGVRNREYLEYFGVNPERIFFTPHFVDNVWFKAKSDESRFAERNLRSADHDHSELRQSDGSSSLRAYWGADQNTLVVLFVGKFIPKKRPEDILKAIAHIERERGIGRYSLSEGRSCKDLNFLVVFVGAGELGDKLRGAAERLGVKAYFAGFRNQNELPSFYAASDVIVLPSDGGETWGLVVNEAMACGLPAIVSDAVGCGPDLIEEGKTGFTFPLGDHLQLAARIWQLSQLRMAEYVFSSALEKKMSIYSVENAVSGTLNAINCLIDSKGR